MKEKIKCYLYFINFDFSISDINNTFQEKQLDFVSEELKREKKSKFSLEMKIKNLENENNHLLEQFKNTSRGKEEAEQERNKLRFANF